ncbi:ribonuclease H-like domain-containing protein [Sporodiniella umbellata]|nr:ribonuclease H-like domain-containing protein [Sporodiniella umbellata]
MIVSTTAGSISGAFIAALSCPFELVKIQKQLEYLLQASSISTGDLAVIRPTNELKSTINRTVGAGLPVTPTAIPPVSKDSVPCKLHKRTVYTSTSSWYSAREILKKRGLTGLYNGFCLHLARDAIGTGVYFGGYETTKYTLSKLRNTPAGPGTQFLAGGICGIMCWLVVFPLDLVKSLIQKEILQTRPKYGSTKNCIQDIYRKGGLAGFYKGITVTLIRAFPIHSLNFLVYEQTLFFFFFFTVMEIPRQQFSEKLSEIEKAIKECDVIAIDTELSGLHRPTTSKRLYSLEDRYIEYKEATERFIIIQFGFCAFKWDAPSGRYIAKPFNFNIFPTSIMGNAQPNRVFMTQAQAFDFLVRQTFDFNKWVYQGIPYLTKEEEKTYREQGEKRMNDDMPTIPVDEKEYDFMQDVKRKIEAWINDKKADDGINIAARNSYQRRLIYQEVRNNYGEYTALGMQGFIRVTKLTEKQHEERKKEKVDRFESDCLNAVGFRRVIDLLSESKKMIVGHNMLLDVCHVIGQFVQPLPDTLAEFKEVTRNVFPNLIDTKYMCAVEPKLFEIFGTGTALEQLRFETSKESFSNPRIDMHPQFPRYLTEKAHEAGYDAFMTGAAFLRLASYLDISRNPAKTVGKEELDYEKANDKKVDSEGWEVSGDEEKNNWYENGEDEEVYNYGSTEVELFFKDGSLNPVLEKSINKSVMVRTAYECFDFVSNEVAINQKAAFHVTPKGIPLTSEKAQVMFSKYGKFVLEKCNDVSHFVVFERAPYNFDFAEYESEYTVLPIARYYESINL